MIDVAREYERLLAERRAQFAARDRSCLYVSVLRLALVAAGALIPLLLGLGAAYWIAVPAAIFIPVAVWHGRLLNSRDRATSAIAYYERSLARTRGEWIGRGRDGDRFRPVDHLYAADLNIFGRGSLFELLATTRTTDGDETLARWLLAPASAEVVRARQQAVRELIPRLDLREAVAVIGDVVRQGVDGSRLRSWATSPIRLRGTGPRVALAALVVASLSSLVWWWRTDTYGHAALALFVLQAVVAQWLKGRVEHIEHSADEASHDLDVLAELLRILEHERFNTPLLQRLQGAVGGHTRPPSREIANLSIRVAMLSSRENLIFRIPASVVMWTTQWAFAVETWRAKTGADVPRWLDAIGEFEALLAFSTLSFEQPAYTFPDIVDGPPLLVGDAMAHPALPRDAVANDIALGEGPLRLQIVSGSNMSGKSTWLRTIGVNVVLAQAGSPVRAARLRLSPLDVGAGIDIHDSLTDGRSKFFAEIRRVGAIVTLSEQRGGRVLFLFDEIFGGTNSHDRRIGADALLAGLLNHGSIGLATTHDLALGAIADRLAPAASNVHFEDRFENDVLTFDYRIRPGIVQTSNALALMRSVGIAVSDDAIRGQSPSAGAGET